MASVRLKNIHKYFGSTHVLKGIDLALEEGEFLVLVGPSGCGKSTLLNIIAGLETISSGTVRIGERSVNAVPPKDRDIAMVFQSYALYPTKSVSRNITFGMETRGVPKREQQRALAEVTGFLHIDELLARKPAQLSGGQRQRVAMGRALVRKPAVFLFDEPLSNLDAKLRIEMRTEIKKLHQRLGKTIVYVTHDQIEAMTLASRIAVMDNGHVRQFADPATIYEEPDDLFVAGFIGSPPMNMLHATVRRDGGLFARVGEGEAAIQFPLPRSLLDRATAYEGQNVILGLRPETITAEGAEQLVAEGFTFQRPVEVVEPTGPDTMIVFSINSSEVIARVRPRDEKPVGADFTFVVDMSKAKLFDPDTGQKI